MYQYGREYPTKENWNQWKIVLLRFTLPNRYLLQPLGAWIAPSQQIWRYHLNAGANEIEVVRGEEIDIYLPAETEGRASKKYLKQRTVPIRVPSCSPASVSEMDGGALQINVTGPALYQPAAPQEKSSIEFLHSWGGTWMWKGLAMPVDKKWLTNAVTNNTLVCVTDRSCSQEKAPDICGDGWIIYCTATKQHISMTLVERLDSTSTYRGELLGMLAIHLILLAIEEY